jgi:hypothetical protein
VPFSSRIGSHIRRYFARERKSKGSSEAREKDIEAGIEDQVPTTEEILGRLM